MENIYISSKKHFLKKKLKLPESPGVYIFWGKNKPIYIGKSVNLKNRVLSYFSNNLGLKTRQMILHATNLTYIKVNSEIESLLLEAELVKKWQPKYNILLKDDKHPLYIAITNDELPRLITIRRIETINKNIRKYFGPFPNSGKVKSILKLIRKIIPFSDHKLGKKGCLYSHIGLCDPCPNVIKSTSSIEAKKIYLKNINLLSKIFERKFNFVRKMLIDKMNLYAKSEEYEKAKIIREQIKQLDYITQPITKVESFLENPNFREDVLNEEISEVQKLLNLPRLIRVECFDIAHFQGRGTSSSMIVSINGEMSNNLYRHFKINQEKKQSDYDSLLEVANRRFKHLSDWGKPDLIIVDGGIGQVNIFKKVFKNSTINIVGIAKDPDRLILNDKKIKLKGSVGNFFIRHRDEAHRFAGRYHRILLNKLLFDK